MSGGSVFNQWNFTDNPFSAMPLGADSTGNRLFIGRDDELRKIAIRLASSSSAICLDGLVGVGKTSLANIAAFRAQQAYLADRNSKPLIVPCRRSFQVSESESPDDFRLRVLTEVAQTLLDKATPYRLKSDMEGSAGLNAWLNSPLLNQWSLGVPVFSAGGGTQANESSGFTSSGFVRTVIGWLENIFPEDRSGGVVCVLDNLELLETSTAARKKIEALRDTLFTIRGLRWILCGAHGILQGVVASQRLVGHLQEPVHVPPLTLAQAQDVFNARVSTFSIQDGRETYLPMEADDFHRLYLIVHSSLRNTLAYASDYCMHVAESASEPKSSEEKRARFDAWLKRMAKTVRDAVQSQVSPRGMQLFLDAVARFEGEFSPSDFEALGFKSVQAMRPHVRNLEDVGLLEAQKDDIDQRRKSISVTGKGWLIHWSIVTHAE